MIVPAAIFFRAPDRQYQMCVNGVSFFFFFSLERVSDAMYSCTQEELSLFHGE